VRWSYGGLATVTTAINFCICANSRFDLDGYERAWVPSSHCFAVSVLDGNGNLIARIGRYGNGDSKGKDSPVVDPATRLHRPRKPTDPATLLPPKELSEGLGLGAYASYVAASDEAVYIADQGNRRIVRGKITYKAEEIVPAP
jgi:hypothetical protein